jgi:uncharacterized membrane protein (DUF106 family)
MTLLQSHAPLVLILLLSLVVGLLMVVVFRYTSDQKAIRVAKDHLKAHILAVQLFQDQLPVVLTSYWRILRNTGRYLQLAFKPLLYVIIPLTFLIVQLDRYLGLLPVQSGQPFLVEARLTNAEELEQTSLQLPPEITLTASPVRVPERNEIVWRVAAEKDGYYYLHIAAGGESLSKSVVVSAGVARTSPLRLRDRWWERLFVSGEPALPANSPIQSIRVNYPERNISFAWLEWNWIWLFFVVSLISGFIFKSILGIEI